MSNVIVCDHPLVQHKISLLRDKNTGSKEFRELVQEIAMFMCYEATRDLPLKEVQIETPLALANAKIISGRKVAFVPIMRAGLGMMEGALALVPAAKVGHIGLYRDESNGSTTHEYYCKLPFDIANREVIIRYRWLRCEGHQHREEGRSKADKVHVHRHLSAGS